MNGRHRHLGQVVLARRVRTNRMTPARVSGIVFLLAASVALTMTGFGIIMPIFPRRLADFGAGVEALGIMTMAFALTQMIAAPIAGTLADRLGRKPLILIALLSFALANLAYLVAPSAAAFIAIRAIAGAFTAGLFPAAMGVVADIAPERDRARWVGIVMGGYGAGLVFGPVLGGLLYDSMGFAMPFVASAAVAGVAFLAALGFVPETRPAVVRRRESLISRRQTAISGAPAPSLWDVLPRPLTLFAGIVLVDFVGSFAFAYVEPQMVFYIYDSLGWTTAQFGLLVGGYGLAMMLGQVFLGQTSDRFGRKPVIVAGIFLNGLLYPGMAFVLDYWLLFAIGVVAGLGAALTAPALSALLLDITQPNSRSQVLGIRGSILSLGGVLGPLLVSLLSGLLTPQQIFLSAAALLLVSLVVALLLLREPVEPVQATPKLAEEIVRRRALAAQATLQGLVLSAQEQRTLSGRADGR